MGRCALRDGQWARIRDQLPGRLGSVGVTARDNRLFVETVVYRYRTGLAWRDLPERFGDGVKVQRRFSSVALAGTGVVAVLHDLTLAARFCDRIVVLGEGRVAADGHPDVALTDRLLSDVFGVTVCRGAGPDGTAYILPWNRSGPHTEEIDATFTKQS